MTRAARPGPRGGGLAGRLMAAQVVVIAVGALALALAAGLVAPGLFRSHLARSGVTDPNVRHHADEAFAAALSISLTVAAAAALVAAGIASWLVVRKLSRPVTRLARAADTVAAGNYHISVPTVPFSTELQQLSDAFGHMAARLADTDAARTRLLSDLSHELRTPLATLAAYIDGMEDGVLPARRESWQTMRAQVERLRRLSTDVRDVAIAEEDALSVRFVALDVGELARAAVAAVAPLYAARQLHLELVGGDDLPAVPGDAERLGQVLTNLLDNALRHTPGGGHVRVEVGADAATRSVVLRVRDDGTGIPADELESVFERFHRVDPARGGRPDTGSGLGLTIARAIVHSHGGTITAANNGDGAGATLTVTLPARS